jgi:exosortase family protein XrtF
LKNYFILYKPFLLFLGKFFLTYLLLTTAYQSYLDKNDDGVDRITTHVANLTESVARLMDVPLSTESNGVYYAILYQDRVVGRIIEGCNAISVIILFISFVVAFSGKWKPTSLFILTGSLLIYVLNIFRIIFLVVLLYHYPTQEHLLHGVLFPLIIYGIVFVLWVIWVNNFSKYASKTSK